MVAPSPAEVVHHAGGWLFDQAMAGWDVTVLTADRSGGRALRILGARPADLESALASAVRGPKPQAVAAGAALAGSDARIRRLVLDVLADDDSDVRLWGGQGPVRHRLSAAALAFKAQALAAVAGTAPAGASEVTELFGTGDLLRPSRRS